MKMGILLLKYRSRLERTLAILLILAGVLSSSCLDAQVIQRDEEGTYIIRYPDNSWRNFQPRDSFLYRNLIADYEKNQPADVYVERNSKNIEIETEKVIDEVEVTQPSNTTEKKNSFPESTQAISEDEQVEQNQKKTLTEQLEEQGFTVYTVPDWEMRDDTSTVIVPIEGENNAIDAEMRRIQILKEVIEEQKKQATQDQSQDRYWETQSAMDNLSSKQVAVFHYNRYNFPKQEQSDLIKHPPVARCQTELIIDPKTNEKSFVLPMRELLTFTPDKLKLLLDEDAYLTFTGQLWKKDSDYFFRLSVLIRDKQARASFGGIPMQASLELQLINGNVVNIKNQLTAEFIPIKGDEHKLEALFKLERDDLKQLERYELDRMRVHWGAGYEDYDLYNLMFFQNQIACLKKI